ncbi:hypothetical protein HOR53_gp07 [Pectobacterium phage PP99]|uniref:Uncharacterized protein n=1 Tax=Pectobacterium phage PP99 TaxID=1932883 RepID=A0A2R4PAG8_9CAUD|nr:hypothetical protein HOR53_gp07 [Pectobacterium phage PP99]AVX48048.1 hypothetical protein PP99_07 [Pectobacterium phage PP99]
MSSVKDTASTYQTLSSFNSAMWVHVATLAAQFAACTSKSSGLLKLRGWLDSYSS